MRIAALALLLAALPAASAQADSLVFTLRGNVVRVDPDRPTVREVVARRGAGAPFIAVTQADDGSMVAQRDRSFVRLSRTGKQRGVAIDADPRPTAPSAFGPYDPELSPNGRYLAWWNGFNFLVSLPTLTDAYGNLTDTLNFFTGPVLGEVFFPNNVARNTGNFPSLEGSIFGPWASWYGNEGIVTGSPRRGGIDYDPIDGKGEPVGWFADSLAANLLVPRVTRQRDRLAAVQHSRFAPQGTTPKDEIRVYQLDGRPPALPPAGCVIPARGSSFRELSWSPDGKRLVWSDDQGIWIAGVPRRITEATPDNCPLNPRPRLLVRGGDEPHWGPADVPRRRGR